MPVLEFNMTEETKSHLHLQSQSAAQKAPFQRRSTGLCHRRKPLRKEQTAFQFFFQISTKARKLNNFLKYEVVFFLMSLSSENSELLYQGMNGRSDCFVAKRMYSEPSPHIGTLPTFRGFIWQVLNSVLDTQYLNLRKT